MSKKTHNQCRYCKNYKAYDFHGFKGEKIYACEKELSRSPCIFEYDENKEKAVQGRSKCKAEVSEID